MTQVPKSIHIAITREDGSLSIMEYLVLGRGSMLPEGAEWFDQKAGVWSRRATDELIEKEIARACTDGVHGAAIGWRVIRNLAEVPKDRTYRNAWVDTGKRVEHDMPKAREIHRQHIRKRRAAVLRELDGQWMRAVGRKQRVPDEAERIEAERQKWRDMPNDPRIDQAQSVEELLKLKDSQ